jgi:dipeptidase E
VQTAPNAERGMRLYLSSLMIGDHVDRLLAMTGPSAATAIVSNAIDHISEADRREYARTSFDAIAYFERFGFRAEHLDLRSFFADPSTLHEALVRFGLVWVLGGNTFVLRRAMQASGFDPAIARWLGEEKHVYGGWSAGAVVVGPDLAAMDLMDDPDVSGIGHPASASVTTGMGLIDFRIVPHVASDHPESRAAGIACEELVRRGLEYRPLRDGDVIIRDEAGVSLFGRHGGNRSR